MSVAPFMNNAASVRRHDGRNAPITSHVLELLQSNHRLRYCRFPALSIVASHPEFSKLMEIPHVAKLDLQAHASKNRRNPEIGIMVSNSHRARKHLAHQNGEPLAGAYRNLCYGF